MAIDRKDYQYIHNSLDKTSVVSNDNSLKVGNKVKNLLLELKEENMREQMVKIDVKKNYYQ